MTKLSPRIAALTVLVVGAFGTGAGQLVVIGVLDELRGDIGVSVSAAGWVVSVYALGVCIGGPLLATRTGRCDRRSVMIGALAVFAVGNAVMAAGPSLGFLLAVAPVVGAVHGLYVGTATAHAAGLGDSQHRGRAVALVFGGVAVGTTAGAAGSALIGQALGWRTAFAAVAVLGLAALVAMVRLVPPSSSTPAVRSAGIMPALPALPAVLPVLVMLVLVILLMGGVFTFYTYVTAFLGERTRVAGPAVGVFLLAFGVAGVVGTMVGGRIADQSPHEGMVRSAALTMVTMTGLLAGGTVPIPTAILLAMCGFAGAAFIPAFQLQLMTLAGPAADLAATVGASATNAGIALGSALGGAVLSRYGVDAVLVLATALVSTAAVGSVLSRRLSARGQLVVSDGDGV